MFILCSFLTFAQVDRPDHLQSDCLFALLGTWRIWAAGISKSVGLSAICRSIFCDDDKQLDVQFFQMIML